MRSISILTIVVAILFGIFKFTDKVNTSLKGPNHPPRVHGAKTEKVAPPEAGNGAERVMSEGKNFVGFLKRPEKAVEKSDLQKLLQRRRSESRFLEVENNIEIRDHRQ